jgi:hypothetical protein
MDLCTDDILLLVYVTLDIDLRTKSFECCKIPMFFTHYSLSRASILCPYTPFPKIIHYFVPLSDFKKYIAYFILLYF